MSFDPISWAISLGAKQIAAKVLDHLTNPTLTADLRAIVVEWAASIPETRHVEPAAMFLEPTSAITPAEKPALACLREELTKRIPSREIWLAALLEQWRDVRKRCEDPQPFFSLPEKEAEILLLELTDRIIARCRLDDQLYRSTVLEQLETVREEVQKAWKEQRSRLTDYLSMIKDRFRTVHFLGLPTLKELPDTQIDHLFVQPYLSRTFISPDWHHDHWGRLLTLREAIAAHSRLVILGDPGTGKSTIVNWLAYQLSTVCPTLNTYGLADVIPIPFIVRDYGILRGVSWDDLITKFLTIQAHRLLQSEQLLNILQSGNALLMFDGVDEISDEQARKDLRSAIQQGISLYGGCRWLITSRVVGYREVPFHTAGDIVVDDLEEDTESTNDLTALCFVAPFQDKQISRFALNWYTARDEDKVKAQGDAEDLFSAVSRDADTLRLARIPNILTMMAIIHRTRAFLPDGKALLYDDIAKAYLETIDHFRKLQTGAGSFRDKKRWLSRLAFEMQRLRNTSGKDADSIVADGHILRGWLAAALNESRKAADPQEVLRFLERIRKRSGLMIERAEDRFAFTHLSFQEFFAAVHIKERINTPSWLQGKWLAEGTAPIDLRKYANSYAWQEVLVFLFELIADEVADWKDVIRDTVFGERFDILKTTDVSMMNAFQLLARLINNRHVGWEDEVAQNALRLAFQWAIVNEQHTSQDYGRILPRLLSGGPDAIARRGAILREAIETSKVRKLVLSWTDLTDWSGLAGVRTIQHLVGIHTPIEDLKPIAGMDSLKYLWLSYSRVRDLRPLSGLHKLEELHLSDTPVEDISPICKLPRLWKVRIGGTRVRDLTALNQLTSLVHLDMMNVKVDDLSALYALPKLRKVFMYEDDAPGTEITEMRRRRPDVSVSTYARGEARSRSESTARNS